MRKLHHSQGLVKFTLKNVILFTLACLLTITPSTFAKQAQNSPLFNDTIKSTATKPQLLLEEGEKLYHTGDFKRAIAILQQALNIYQRENNNLGQAAALTNLSLIYQQLGATQEADAAVNKSLQLLGWDDEKNNLKDLNVNHPRSELWTIIAQTLDIQAGLLLTEGKPNQSLEVSQQAEEIWQKLDNSTAVMRNRINQAQALRVGGFYRRSLKILEEIDRNLGTNTKLIEYFSENNFTETFFDDYLQAQTDSAVKVAALRSLGNNYQQLGNLEKSQEKLEQSLEIAQRLQLSEEIALTELSLGNTTRSLLKIEEAINHYHNAAKLASNSVTKIQAQINRINLLINEERITEAKILIPQIQSQLNNLPANRIGIDAQINFARTITKIGNKQDIAEILATAIKQAKTIGDKRAESYGLGSLGELYEQNNQIQEALDLTEKALLLIQNQNASDIAYLWDSQLGRLFKAQNKIPQAILAFDRAIENLDSLRSDLATVNREVQFNFRDRVEPIYRQSVEVLLQEKGENKPNLDKVRQRIEALQLAELDNFFREACLNNQFVALDKVVDQDNTDTAIFYPIILENKLEIILKLPQRELIHKTSEINSQQLEEIITEIRKYIVQVDRVNQFKKTSFKLYQLLIKPVEKELNNSPELKNSQVKTLVFIPDGSLRNIPIGALYDGQEYLFQKYAIAISPGLQLFTPKSLTRQQLNALAGGLSEIPKTEDFAPLPNVQEELASIKESGISTLTLYNDKFTSNTLEQQINARPFQVVHFATHGQFSSDPRETFILASDKRINVVELDNLLKSRGQKRTEPIELLVLSACETAAGDNRAALGLAGIALSAGARSTLGSLWQIGDDSTAYFIDQFYHQLMTGKTTAQALRFAQLNMLKNSEYNRPMYWAPYVLVGNWL